MTKVTSVLRSLYKEYVENFKWAFERGCSWSNMGGVEGTLDDGLTKFKDNFNPTINEFIGEFDIPVYPFMYRLTQKAYKILKSKHVIIILLTIILFYVYNV